MDPVLEKELSGAPVAVKLAGSEYPLHFSIRAVILYKQVTGDNLFDGDCWVKIAPLEDPERFLACLWAGLHYFDESAGKWVEPFTLAQLERLVDFSNITETCEVMARTLASYFPDAKNESTASGEPPLPAPAEASSEASPSPSSGPSPASTSS